MLLCYYLVFCFIVFDAEHVYVMLRCCAGRFVCTDDRAGEVGSVYVISK